MAEMAMSSSRQTMPSALIWGRVPPREEAGYDEQQTTDGQTITRSDKDIDATTQSASHQIRECSTEGVEDNHSIAQPRKLSTLGTSYVERKDAAESYHTAYYFLWGEFVALETGAGQ